ncbi:phosphopantothenoylcysteine decarboxylase [Roseofilum capinflatum]|uniref:Phosphopantothenoylcysteine decarboxylase n=1 Tax=Roseofilum capinflatum BLCC-M114 TaxID=3022440 RepID=A0ABT7B5L5_9CYAN|nr:phosphopantothenoylcysteine decarboxylase [Roseofilum capinflatum]MDJ1174462.1 phosphopantothenoylcysteine decarboxylase [Roseofilum capinflatum BLCC-M114]
MEPWYFTPPPSSELGDREVPLHGTHLQGKRIALLITGSIAALKAPLLARELRREGAEVVAFTSTEALRYTTLDSLEWSTTHRVITKLTAAAEHLSDEAPFDAYVVAPATYNTINKMRYGIADGVITSTLASALGKLEQGQTKILIVPTMHGSLHNRILTESLQQLQRWGVEIMPPKQAYGKDNLPDLRSIVTAVSRLISSSRLKGIPVLVTGGPTPVPIDNIRRITNRFRGTLSIKITEELYLRGAEVQLILGTGGDTPPPYLPYELAQTYEQYAQLVLEQLQETPYIFAIFSAAVADYQPEQVLPGKIPSGGAMQSLKLVPTAKVIERVRAQFPDLYMVTFKYQEQVSHEELMGIAQQRLAQGYNAVVANRGEEMGENGEQVAYWVSEDYAPEKMMGKEGIARAIGDRLEEFINVANI